MLETTLQQLQVILQTNLNDVALAEKVLDFMTKYYTQGKWIYPGVLKRKFDLKINTVYTILIEMQEIGILSPYYEVMCDKCNRTIGDAYPSIDSIPEYITCEHCEDADPINAAQNAYLIYKVNADE